MAHCKCGGKMKPSSELNHAGELNYKTCIGCGRVGHFKLYDGAGVLALAGDEARRVFLGEATVDLERELR